MNIEDIQRLVRDGFSDWGTLGAVSVKEYDDLLQFNYQAPANKTWNEFECLCRGLILEATTGEVIARPFDKFFNYGEGGKYPSTNKIKHVIEKVDGSMGIIYWHLGEWHVATRGSLESYQAFWAEDFLYESYQYEYLQPGVTYIVEIIYPGNRIVVDYGDLESLVLIAARNKFSGLYLDEDYLDEVADDVGFLRPLSYSHESVEQITSQVCIMSNFEGYVAIFEDGTRWKFKSDEYMRIHRIASEYKFERVAEAHRDGILNDLIESCPPWLQERLNADKKIIEAEVYAGIYDAQTAFKAAPRETRKEFALYAKENAPKFAPVLFSMLDGKPYHNQLYKILFNI